MIEIIDQLKHWHEEAQPIALATVVQVDGSAPRDPGASLAVNRRGDVAGSVSGGCVESAVYEEAERAIETGRPVLATYGISDEEAFGVGLTCGGTIHVFVEPFTYSERLDRALRTSRPISVVTRLDGDHIGAKLIVDASEAEGNLGSPGLTYAAAGEARALLAVGETTIRTFGADGEPVGNDVRVFIQSFAPRPDMYIFGAVDFSRAMAAMGKYLGYRVTVVDARPIFATKARIPDADEVIVRWPHEFLAEARVDERTVLIVLTHDEKFDIPLLRHAVGTPAAYIGAMGSRSTHANRVALLREAGLSDADLARVSAPVGLDLGARTPEETAVSIAAEVIALRYGRGGDRLSSNANKIHGERIPQLAR